MSAPSHIPRVLSIAGTDPTGGAGIQADLKSIAANGGYGMAVVTALVAQNTQGVRSIHVPPVAFLREQLDAVSDDVQLDAVKIGMLATGDVIRTVTDWLLRVRPPVVVLDPVMVATSGDRLVDADAEAALLSLLAHVHLVTPNMAELAVLAGEPVADDWPGVLAQAHRVSARYGVKVLAKGGHLRGSAAPDALVDAAAVEPVLHFPGERVSTRNTHGTGCSLSAALATRRVGLGTWAGAVTEAKRWLTESLQHADELHIGQGHGPIHHFAGLWARGGTLTRPTPAALAEDWWERLREIRAGIEQGRFIQGIANGSLPEPVFHWYLAQDTLYLRDYARALADASRLAPTLEEQVFWAGCAHAALATEAAGHLTALDTPDVSEVLPSATTRGYVNHLLAVGSRGNYGDLIAALLPCFWLYQELGERLQAHSRPDHPYRAWLESYADPEFAASTRTAIELVTRAASVADVSQQVSMWESFHRSAVYEQAFFDAPVDACAEVLTAL